jgi:DNA invertase Pin-like site-specific DNA recombinase
MKRIPRETKQKAGGGPPLVGYARVSTDDQDLSLQIEALRRAGVHGDNIHSEKKSGVAKMRQSLDDAIADLRAGDTLVVWRLDRLGRDMRELHIRFEQIKQKGATFRSLNEQFDTGTASGRLALNITAAFAQFERDVIGERTRAGMQLRKEKGYRMGREPALSDADRKKALAALAKGARVRDVASAFGVSEGTIRNYRRAALPKRKAKT